MDMQGDMVRLRDVATHQRVAKNPVLDP